MARERMLALAVGALLGVFCAEAGVIYDNGPLVTHWGAGAGGADVSALQTALGMSLYGFGAQASLGYRLADNFTVPSGSWTINSAMLYAYQTYAPIGPSTITGVTLQIWSGRPGDPGSSVIWGDTTTNRLVSSIWLQTYRTRDIELLSTSRPIMENVVSVGVTLGPGTYWLDWDFAGSASYTGPWNPPITILGQTTTGNARQYTTAWADVIDTGTSAPQPQGLPFVLDGFVIPEPSTFGFLALGVGALVLASRRSRR